MTQENMLSCILFREVAHGLACDAASAGGLIVEGEAKNRNGAYESRRGNCRKLGVDR